MLDRLGVAPGRKVIVDFLPSGRTEIRAAQSPGGPIFGGIEGFIGCLGAPGTSRRSVDKIDSIIASGWGGRT